MVGDKLRASAVEMVGFPFSDEWDEWIKHCKRPGRIIDAQPSILFLAFGLAERPCFSLIYTETVQEQSAHNEGTTERQCGPKAATTETNRRKQRINDTCKYDVRLRNALRRFDRPRAPPPLQGSQTAWYSADRVEPSSAC